MSSNVFFGSSIVSGARSLAVPKDGFSAVSVSVDINGIALPSQTFALLGPGHVKGIDKSVIRRCWPLPGSADTEPNLMAFVEFTEPDFPWLMSPAAPTKERILPWLTLLVLHEGEFELRPAPTPSGDGLPSLVLKPGAMKPIFPQLWAWAHVQADSRAALEAKGLGDRLRSQEAGITSRLVCPRRLKPDTRYTAFLVPTFRSTAIALRRSGAALEDEQVDAFDLADLPVVHSWSFGTTTRGDFESLTRGLRPLSGDLRGKSERFAMDAAFGGLTLSRPVFLRPLEMPTDEEQIATPIRQFLADITSPVRLDSASLRPPIYGIAYAPNARLAPIDITIPQWRHALNRDPRYRAVAALGAAVVRANEQALVASALEQIQGIVERNRYTAAYQVGRELTHRSLARFLKDSPNASARIAHGVIDLGGDGSRPPESVIGSSVWRRQFRPGGPLGRRFRKGPTGPVDIGTAFLRRSDGAEPSTMPLVTVGFAAFADEYAAPTVHVWERDVPSVGAVLAFEQPQIDDLRLRMAHFSRFGSGPAPAQQPVEPANARLSNHRQRVSPERTFSIDALFPDAGDKRVRVVARSPDDLDPVKHSPQFSGPLFAELREHWVEWLLPTGVSIPAETIAVMKPDAAVIEAFIVGMNDQFGRELLWRGFPTPFAGSFFRNFWERPGDAAPDFPDLHSWRGQLGSNGVGGANPVRLLFIMRSELIRRYPNMQLFAVKSVRGLPSTEPSHRVMPNLTGTLSDGVSLFGFPLSDTDVLGATDDEGYFFVIAEAAHEARMGLDEPPETPETPETPEVSDGDYWRNLSWTQLGMDVKDDWVDLDRPPSEAPPDRSGHLWGGDGTAATSASIAAILQQRPYMVVRHSRAFIPRKGMG